jgi:aldose 1-epimerase
MPEPTALPATLDLRAPDDTLRLTVLDIGATWYRLQLRLPGLGAPREVLLRGADPAAHVRNTAYLGATVGRWANRIAHGRITDPQDPSRQWTLARATGHVHQLHGGPGGASQRRWRIVQADAHGATLALDSADGDQGFPGALQMTCTLRLEVGGRIVQTLSATLAADAPAASPVCLTHHGYFNLDGVPAEGPPTDVRDHRLRVAAAQWLPVDDTLIPLGALAPVDGSGFDLSAARLLREAHAGGDLDHAFLVAPAAGSPIDTAGPHSTAAAPVTTNATANTVTAPTVAELGSADGRLRLTLGSTQPALQVYTGRWLDQEHGADGRPLPAHAGIALEPQWLPDSPNHPEWPQPDCWLAPGATWTHTLVWDFACPTD